MTSKEITINYLKSIRTEKISNIVAELIFDIAEDIQVLNEAIQIVEESEG